MADRNIPGVKNPGKKVSQKDFEQEVNRQIALENARRQDKAIAKREKKVGRSLTESERLNFLGLSASEFKQQSNNILAGDFSTFYGGGPTAKAVRLGSSRFGPAGRGGGRKSIPERFRKRAAKSFGRDTAEREAFAGQAEDRQRIRANLLARRSTILGGSVDRSTFFGDSGGIRDVLKSRQNQRRGLIANRRLDDNNLLGKPTRL